MSTAPPPSLPDHVRREASGAWLTVDLGAVQENYRRLCAAARNAEVAACVKADAYGLGVAHVVPALLQAGCRSFFVAEPLEGAAVRTAAPDATIYVLDGFFPEAAAIYRDYALRPVLATRGQIEAWAGFTAASSALPAGLHFDTGINRLGLSAQEAGWLADASGLRASLDIRLVMSHLACAEETNSPMNTAQLARFRTLRAAYPEAQASLCNTAGVFLGPDYHFDLIRPGIGLYGGNPMHGRRDNPFLAAAHVRARILQVRDIAAGETVGYGATFTAQAPTRIATLATGYGDGFFRRVGDGKPQAEIVISGRKAPVVGRVSMDLITADVTHLPGDLTRAGDMAEILGETVTVDHLATAAGTIGYEVLTRLGNRYHRSYKTTEPGSAALPPDRAAPARNDQGGAS